MILKHVSELDIFMSFLGINEFPKKNISSPFSEDKNPSFSLYCSEKNSQLKFKCNSTGKQGDVWQFVADLNNLDCKNDFKEVCKLVARKMNIVLQNTSIGIASPINKGNTGNKTTLNKLQRNVNSIAKPKESKELFVTKKADFSSIDLEYWNNLGVSKDLLKKFNVHAISEYHFTNQKPQYIKNGSVAFSYELDGQLKLYIPEQKDVGVKKQILPAFEKGIFGLLQLGNDIKEEIIICEGEKDVIIATSRGFNAITFGSASKTILKNDFELLQKRCKRLYVCFDNDDSGKNGAKKLIDQFPEITQLQLPEINGLKGYDLTDYFQEHTPGHFKKLIADAKPEKNIHKFKYDFPSEIKEPIEKYIYDIENYQMFMANYQIWIMKKNEKRSTFYSVSNFEISILQHLQDEKFPIKLVRLKNTHKSERVFDIPADGINTLQKLDNVLSNQGNFRFHGNSHDFNLLKRYLLDKMGTGKKIEVLGWQEKGNFWVWNNKINLCNGKYLEIDKYGCFNHEGKSYYIPSANKFNEDNEYQYESQKKFIVVESSNNIKDFIAKAIEVHRDNAISAILFTISSLFSDIVFNKTGGFPILFLYGKFGSGKTQLAKCCQSFFGKPQDALNLENGTSTKVAHIRELSQFKNSISHLAEYKPGNRDIDGTLKGIYDRNGYKRGVKESNRGTDSVPIESTALLTGNYYPNDEALISRLNWLELQENEFSPEGKKKYQELDFLIDQGVSCFSDQLLCKRDIYISAFYQYYKEYTLCLPELIGTNISRLSQNLAILMTTYKIFEKENIFPFTENEVIEHFKKCTELQKSKLKSADMLTKWWDCFLICCKSSSSENKLSANTDYKLDGNTISFPIGNVYSKVQRQWFLQYRENIPAQPTISEALKKDKCFQGVKNVRIKTGGIPLSSFVIDIEQTNMFSEFLEHYNYENLNV